MNLKAYIVALHAALFAILLAVSPAGSGSMMLLGVGKASGVAYVGPGDVVPSALAWYGLRGYSAAYSTGSNPAVDLVDQANANPITINILANGSLDIASITTWVAAHSVTTIKVKQLYDQSGNLRHVAQATLANMPELVLSVLGSLPAIQFTGSASTNLLGSSNLSSINPTFSGVAKRTNTAFSAIMVHAATLAGAFYSTNANNLAIYAGTVADVGGLDNAFHAFQMAFNGASSTANIDGTPLTGLNPGSYGTSGAPLTLGGSQANSAYFLTGFIAESGMWNTNFSTGNQSSMDSNQHSYWGF